MEVKPGYKRTEVGVIPEEWELKTLGEMFDFSGGYSASRDQLSAEGHCYLHYGDIHKSSKTFVDVRAEFQDIPKLDIPLKRVSANSLIKDGDIVFVDASEDDEGTSKHLVVVNKDKIPFISGLHTIVAKSKTEEMAHEYRRYCFQTPSIRQQFLFYAVGTKVSGISKTNIAKLTIPVPPVPEQRTIATALSDADALLDGLDRLIAKKRDLKQAAMQQLLTGQTRLPGFGVSERAFKQTDIGMLPDDWEVKRVRNLAAITTGSRNTQDRIEDGLYPFFVRSATVERINSYSFDGEAVLTAGDGVGTGKVFHYIKGKFDIHQRVYKISNFCGRLNGRFFFLVFSTRFYDRIMSMTAKSSVDSVRMEMIADMLIPLPTAEEQTAIAAILSDMDAELAALEQRRDKTRSLKQAMMQELLTGKTRLVSPRGSHA